MLLTFPINGKAWHGMLHMASSDGGKFAKQANSSYQLPPAGSPSTQKAGAGSTGTCWAPT